MSEEWGPWIEHDGKGCPCLGMYVHRIADKPGYNPELGRSVTELVGIVEHVGPWIWGNPMYVRVLRYRIRKPRGLTILEKLIADIPQPAKVDA